MNATSPALNREYAGEAATLRTVRRDVGDFLTEHGADGQTVERAALIASELASNAVQAAPGHTYQLALYLVAANAVSLSIRNHTTLGNVPPDKPQWRPVDNLAIRGRGLSIVEQLCDEVSVELDDDTVTVTALFRLVGS